MPAKGRRRENNGRRVMRSLLSSMAVAATVVGGALGAQAATISISCGAVGLELELCQQGATAWAEQTGNQVNVISTPNSATERLALYQQILAANSADIDVFQIDVIWPGTLANHFIDLAEHIPEDADQPALSRRSSRTTRSTARWSRCRGSPTPASSTTARICWRNTARSRRSPGRS